MSIATKRKIVCREYERDFSLPTKTQFIVKLIRAQGRHLHLAETTENEQILVSMPVKFRNSVFVKSGNYVVVEPIVEGKKVKAEIAKILSEEHVKHYKECNVWPAEFCDAEESDDDTEDPFLQPNPNRLNQPMLDEFGSDSDSD